MIALVIATAHLARTQGVTMVASPQRRPLQSIDFRKDFDLNGFSLVKITSVEDIVSPSGSAWPPNHRYRATVLDSLGPAIDRNLTFIDFTAHNAIAPTLEVGTSYLTYSLSNLDGKRGWVMALGTPEKPVYSTPKNKTDDRGLSLAIPTRMSAFPKETDGRSSIFDLLIDGLVISTGREALDIATLLVNSRIPEEDQAQDPFHPVPVPDRIRRVIALNDNSKDPYVRLATATLLGRWRVSGWMPRHLNALADVAEVAPRDLHCEDLNFGGSYGLEDTFLSPEGQSVSLKWARFIDLSISASNTAIQDSMLRHVGQGDLSDDQARRLAALLDATPPPHASGATWNGHLKSILTALEMNDRGPEAAQDPKIGIVPETGEFNLQSAIGYWKTRFHLK